MEQSKKFALLNQEVLNKNIAIKITTKSGSTVLISEKIWNNYNYLVNKLNSLDVKENIISSEFSNELNDFVKNNTPLKEVYFEV
jgi:hypothetical protein